MGKDTDVRDVTTEQARSTLVDARGRTTPPSLIRSNLHVRDESSAQLPTAPCLSRVRPETTSKLPRRKLSLVNGTLLFVLLPFVAYTPPPSTLLRVYPLLRLLWVRRTC